MHYTRTRKHERSASKHKINTLGLQRFDVFPFLVLKIENGHGAVLLQTNVDGATVFRQRKIFGLEVAGESGHVVGDVDREAVRFKDILCFRSHGPANAGRQQRIALRGVVVASIREGIEDKLCVGIISDVALGRRAELDHSDAALRILC